MSRSPFTCPSRSQRAGASHLAPHNRNAHADALSRALGEVPKQSEIMMTCQGSSAGDPRESSRFRDAGEYLARSSRSMVRVAAGPVFIGRPPATGRQPSPLPVPPYPWAGTSPLPSPKVRQNERADRTPPHAFGKRDEDTRLRAIHALSRSGRCRSHERPVGGAFVRAPYARLLCGQPQLSRPWRIRLPA